MHSPPQRNAAPHHSQPRAASPAVVNSCLTTDAATTFISPNARAASDESVSVPEFPRHKLRLLEKLGEGGFGMVSQLLIKLNLF
jgi:hypothetical protein